MKKLLKKRNTLKPSQLTVPADFTLDDPGLTQGMILTFLTCRRKFMFAINRIKPIVKSLTPFFGTFGHKMLEDYYNTGKYSIDNYKTAEYKVDRQLMEFSKAKMKAIMDAYTKIYKKDKFTNIEMLLNTTARFTRRGKIDAIENKRYLVDHKFKGQIREDEISEKLAFDFQSLYYITTYESITGKKLDGVFYNIIRNPSHRLGKTESLSEFTKRLSLEIQKDPAHFFFRFKCTFTEQEKKNFSIELYEIVSDIKKVLSGELYPYKEYACTPGFFNCPYLKACSSNSLEGYTKVKEFYTELKEG